MVAALDDAGVPTVLRFNPVGEVGDDLVQLLEQSKDSKIGGEAVLQIDSK